MQNRAGFKVEKGDNDNKWRMSIFTVEVHELFNLKGDIWFKKGDYYYSLDQVQTIMREVLRAQPQNAQKILDSFTRAEKSR